jgi:hypothetical protein
MPAAGEDSWNGDSAKEIHNPLPISVFKNDWAVILHTGNGIGHLKPVENVLRQAVGLRRKPGAREPRSISDPFAGKSAAALWRLGREACARYRTT